MLLRYQRRPISEGQRECVVTESNAVETRKKAQKGFVRKFKNCKTILVGAFIVTEVESTRTWWGLDDLRWLRY
jgi:hypothetical protein